MVVRDHYYFFGRQTRYMVVFLIDETRTSNCNEPGANGEHLMRPILEFWFKLYYSLSFTERVQLWTLSPLPWKEICLNSKTWRKLPLTGHDVKRKYITKLGNSYNQIQSRERVSCSFRARLCRRKNIPQANTFHLWWLRKSLSVKRWFLRFSRWVFLSILIEGSIFV